MAVKKAKYDIISPDGFSIDSSETYSSMRAAKKAFNTWKKRFEAQGYYSSNDGRIDLEDLEYYCTLVEL